MSGYLIQLKADIDPIDGPIGTQTDFTDLHAWAEVYLPGAGWIGFDVTSGLLCGEGHLPLAASPHYRSAAPITGVVEPARRDFEFAMEVTRLVDPIRITKPFEDPEWQALDELGRAHRAGPAEPGRAPDPGRRADLRLHRRFRGARVEHRRASGPTKPVMARELLGRLRDRFGPGGLLHYGQGKWYPGEPLPRWALGLFWRKDGRPVWRAPELTAPKAGRRPRTTRSGAADAPGAKARPRPRLHPARARGSTALDQDRGRSA